MNDQQDIAENVRSSVQPTEGRRRIAVFLANLPFQIEASDIERWLYDLKLPFLNVNVLRDRETGRSRGVAFVNVESEADRDLIIEHLHNIEIDGRIMRAEIGRDKA